jgi:plastocyanin
MKKRFLIPVVLLVGLVLTITACSKNNDDTNNSSTPTNIYMKGAVYSIPDITVLPGTEITWTNDDNMTHTVTADGGVFNSGDISAGGKFTYKFDALGIYTYHCTYHAGTMTGVVKVATR